MNDENTRLREQARHDIGTLLGQVTNLKAENARLRALTECPTDDLLDGLEQQYEKGNPPNWDWVWTAMNRQLAENKRLSAVVEAATRFIDHRPECAVNADYPCDCGLDGLLGRLDLGGEAT